MITLFIGVLIWLCLVPFFMGTLILSFFQRRDDHMAECLVTGYFAMFAFCQIIIIPMILTEVPFHIFCRVLGVIYLFCAAAGAWKGRTWIANMMKGFLKNLLHHSWTVYAASAAVLVQAYHYVAYMVTNLDDAYYVAVATTAIETDTMYRFSPYTGRAVEGFNLRYCLSPFSMLQAFFSECMNVHPSVLAHTILAPVLVILAYLVYVSMGKLLFASGKAEADTAAEKEKMTGLFILFLSVIHVTSYYCIRNQGSVLLVRIWQGKAVLASVLLPFLFYHCCRMAYRPKEKGNLLILVISTFSCCLVSSMGIALPVVMLGIFALLFGLLKKNAAYFVKMIAGALPCALYGVLYIVLRRVL